MLDVLIAMAMISSVLFSLLLLQIKNVSTAHAAYYHSLANSQLDNMAEMITWARKTSDQAEILKYWNKENTRLLPHGFGFIHHLDHSHCLLTLLWFYHHKQQATIRVFC